jgi:hypothetical protein
MLHMQKPLPHTLPLHFHFIPRPPSGLTVCPFLFSLTNAVSLQGLTNAVSLQGHPFKVRSQGPGLVSVQGLVRIISAFDCTFKYAIPSGIVNDGMNLEPGVRRCATTPGYPI